MPTVITLGGIELPADTPIEWPIIAGVKPAEHPIEVFPEDVAKILKLHGPLDLAINGKVVFSQLWAIREVTGSDPYRAAVIVVDRRRFWPNVHIACKFNMRRPNGKFRIDANASPELSRVEDKIDFARFSVAPDGTALNAGAMLRIVASRLALFEAAETGLSPFTPIFEGDPEGVSGQNDVEVDAAGDTALAQMLGMFAGYTVRVDPLGQVVFYSTARPDAGDAQLKTLGDQFPGAGNARVVNHINECPRAVRVLFSIEAEVRFDYKDVDPTATAEADPHESLRLLKNVIPNPDYTLNVEDATVPQDTLVEADKLLAALPNLPGGGRLTDRMVRAGMIPYCDLYQAICDLSDFDVSGDWRSRINMIMAHFLQTFRIPRDWLDRALAWKNVRNATVNQATGSRSPSMAYGDYALLTAMKRKLRSYVEGNHGGNIEFARNFDGWREVLAETAKPAACKVEVDSDIGLVRLNYQTDPYKNYDMAFPASLSQDAFGAGRVRQSTAGDDDTTPITYDSVVSRSAIPPHLNMLHRVAVILTGIPAAPNDSRQFFAITVTPDRDGIIYETAKAAKGPTMEVRVQPAYEVARLRHVDGRDDVAKVFGVIDGVPNLDGLCVNKEPGSQVKGVRGEGGRTVGASLDEIARSIAERIWASFVPHVQGSAEGDMNPELVPRGWLESVHHTISPDGTMSSRATWPGRGKTLDWMNFISPSARAVMLRQVYRG